MANQKKKLKNKEIILTVRNLSKSFDNKKILDGINLKIFQSQVVALVGPSGEGKSTLLRCIAGLEKFSEGSIDVKGNVGMVFQSYNLFPNLTVLQNIYLALNLVKKIPKEQAIFRANRELEKMGLLDKSNFYPAQLSGGQSQRVAIARALALDPSLILFDEPTSALDPKLKKEVLELIRKVATESSCSILLVTHEIAFAKQIANTVILLEKGQLQFN